MRKTVLAFILLSISILTIHSCKKADPRPVPTAAFTWANAGEGIVQFTDASKEADSYAWDFGNGMTSTEKSPKHDYGKNGKFTVTLTVKNVSGDNKTSQTIDVSSIPAPKTDFTVALGADGLVTFTNTSTGATTFAWELGDGTTSTEASPRKTYTENKKYSVSLLATGKGGTTKTTKEVDVVSIKPVADFSFAEAAGVVTFTNTSKNADTYAWDFGDGSTSTEAAPKKTYTRNATFTVKLTATGKGGAVSASKSVVVAGLETLTFDGCAVTAVRSNKPLTNVTYDAQGRPSVVEILIGSTTTDKYTITYRSLTQIASIAYVGFPFQYTYEYTYANGVLDKIAEKQGTTTTSNIVMTNSNSVVNKMVNTPTSGSVQTYNLAYDAKRNLTKATFLAAGGIEDTRITHSSFDSNVGVYSRGNLFRDIFPVVAFNTLSLYPSISDYYQFLCVNNPTAGKYRFSSTVQRDFTVRYSSYNAKKQPTAYIWADGPLSINETGYSLTYDCTK